MKKIIADKVLADKRLTICLTCTHFSNIIKKLTITAKCNHCGCLLQAKIRLKDSECPIGKW